MEELYRQLSAYIQTACKLNQELPIVIGVSGGADSLCLLHILHRLKFSLVVAHFNHHLRPEASADLTMVAEMAGTLHLPFVSEDGDVLSFSLDHKLSVEEAARTLRYQFLFEQARKYQAQAVAVAHTADDQVETVLMHFLRGAGLDGLKGMLPHTVMPVWDQKIPLVRPLLEIRRAEVEQYCREHDLHPVFDQSNLDPTFFRNRLRHDLIPELETYNPRFRDVIFRTAKLLAADQVTLQALTDRAWPGCLLRAGPAYLALALAPFRTHPLGIQRRLLRRAMEHLRPGVRDVGFEAIERGMALIDKAKDGSCELVGGLQLFAEGDRLWVAEEEAALPVDDWPQMNAGRVALLEAGGRVTMSGGWRLSAARFAPTGPVPDQVDRVWVEAGRVTLPFTVRPRRAGDRFHPLGMGGHSVKLADFFINTKMPQRARDQWPLVCAGDEIVWIPGIRLSENFRVTGETRFVVELRLENSGKS